MLRPINGTSIQYIRIYSSTPNRPEQTTPPPNPEADAPTANRAQLNATSTHPNFNVVPRSLNSVIKIDGEPAELIFSNANGMDCCGYHFLHTSRIMLTTGEPVLNSDGEFQTFRLKTGQMTIQSKAILKGYEQIDVIAYSIKIEGELYADKINLSTAREMNGSNIGLPSMLQQQIPVAGPETQPALLRQLQFTRTAKVQAKEHLTIQTDTLDNASSRIRSNGTVTLKANRLTGAGTLNAALDLSAKLAEDYTHNTQLNAGRHLSISTAERFTNQGILKTQGEITLEAKEFENQSTSLIDGVHLKLKAENSFKNYGVIQGSTVAIDAQHLINDGKEDTDEQQAGAILARDQLKIAAETLHNQEKGLLHSDGDLTIGGAFDEQNTIKNSTRELVNAAFSTLESRGKLLIQADCLNNQKAQMTSGSDLVLKSQKLTNEQGRIEAKGDQGVFEVRVAGPIENQSGWLMHTGAGQTKISAYRMVNRNAEEIKGAGLISGKGSVTIRSSEISNHEGGVIISDQTLKISTFDSLKNEAGTLSASQRLEVYTDNLDNNKGRIIVGEDKGLKTEASSKAPSAPHFPHDKNMLRILTRGELRNRTGQIVQIGAGEIKIFSEQIGNGEFYASGGLISAQGSVLMEARNIFNRGTGQISGGNLILQAKESFINADDGKEPVDTLPLTRYHSSEAMLLESLLRGFRGNLNQKLKGPDSAMIAGDTVLIGTHDQSETAFINKGGIVFAQDRLEIGARKIKSLKEGGVFYSGGTLSMGGELDAQLKVQGVSEQVLNHGSLIDASGDLTIHANELVNQNAGFETKERLIEDRGIHECQDHQGNQRYDGSRLTWYGGLGGFYHVHNSETQVFRFTDYRFTRRVTATVVTHSEPSRIQAGGAIRLSGRVINDKSRIIAGGALSNLEGRPAQIENRDAIGQRVTIDQGTSEWSDRDWHGGLFSRGWTRDWGGRAPYNPAPRVEHHTLNVAVSQQHTAVEHSAPSTALVPSSSALSRNAFLSSGLLRLHTDSSQPYLIQLDPRFTRHSDRVSSDILLRLLNLDPQHIPKRLGDGFYEQQMIRDQIIGLTGHYYLSNHRNPIAEIRDLMHAGADWAKRFQLRLGIEPTPEQVSALTTSLVWLVNQSVQLPDGSEQTVLVQKVYLAQSDAQAVPLGNALISADTIELDSDRPFKNTGTVLSRGKTQIRARQIDNQHGTFASLGALSLQARDNLDSRAGKLIAVKKLTLQAGQDLQLQSQTQTTHAASGSRTNLVGITQIKAGELEATAGSDINLAATEIEVEHDARLEAQQDLILGTTTTSEQLKIVWDERNDLSLSRHTEIGTQIQAGALELKAGRDVTATGAYVKTTEKLAVKAGRDIHLEAAYEETDFEESHYHESSNLFGSSSELTHNTLYRKQALSSTLSGGTIQIEAGHDLNIIGSNVVGMRDVDLSAANNIKQKAVEQIEKARYHSVTERSGLLDSGTLGVTIGTRTQKDTQENEHTPHIGSVIGSVSGHVRAIAGHEYEQSGSQWVVPTGDIKIRAGKGKINAAYEEGQVWQRSEYHQSGLTVSASAPVIAATQTNHQMLQASSQVNDSRMQVLAAGAGALATKNAYDAIKADPKAAGGATVSVMIGEEQCETEQMQRSKTALNSTLAAGGNISIQIGGLGEDSTLDLIGARLEAKQDITLDVEGRLNVEAAPNSLIEQSQQQSQSSAVGAVATLGSQSSVGASVTLSVGHGHADGAQISYTPTLIQAGGKLTLNAQSDVRLKGAQMAGAQVQAQIEGNLEIESVQNTNHYHSHSQSISGSATAGSVSAASLNFSQRRMDSHYLSVAEQAGIQAGDGGFQITVKGDTKLVGGVIAGSEQAVQEKKNTLMTGTLQQTYLKNQASYDASSISLGGGYSQSGKGVGSDQSGEAITPAHSGNQLASRGGMSAAIPIVMSASGQAQSTTRSAISGAEIVITDEARQIELTGHSAAETIASLNRNPAQSHQALEPIFNQSEIGASFDIVNALGREAGTFLVNRAREADHKIDRAKRIEILAGNEFIPIEQRQELLEAAAELRTQAQALNKQWGPGGLSRRVLTALTAAASGNVTGATEQFVQSGVVNLLQQQGASYIGTLVKSGAINEGSAQHAALHALVGLGGAAASNQSLGAGALGGAVSSILTHAFSPTHPDETRTEQEAKNNLATTLVTGVAALIGADSTVATHSAAAAIDNNWLATEQKALVQKELEACEDNFACKALTELKWTGVAAKQTTVLGAGFIEGVGEVILEIPEGIVELVLHPIEAISGLISLVKNKEVRAQVGQAISAEWDAKINRIEVAIAEGGDENAWQLGREGGRLFCHVIMVCSMAGGVVDLAALLGKAGVRLSKKALEEVSKLSKFEHLARVGSSSVADSQLLATASQSANIAKIEEKLQYFFGKATGTEHGIERSRNMLLQLEKIGLSDTPAARQYLFQSILEAYGNPASFVRIQENGRVVRHSMLIGPNGGAMLETIWEGSRLTTGTIFKSKGGRYRHELPTGK